MTDALRRHGPRVSVVVPARNAAHDLPTLLAALRRQTLPREDFEVVVVDDRSTDATPDLVRASGFAKLVEAPVRGGSYAARNLAVRLVDAPVLAFTDSDCAPTPTWLEEGLAELASTGADLVAGQIEIPLVDGSPASALVDAARHLNQEKAVADGFGATANLFVQRRVFETIGLFNENLQSGGDTEFGHRARAAGLTLVLAANAVVVHPARGTPRQLARKAYRLGFGAAQHIRHAEGPLRERNHICKHPGAYVPSWGIPGLERLERLGLRPGFRRRLAMEAVHYFCVQLPIVAGNIHGTLYERRRAAHGLVQPGTRRQTVFLAGSPGGHLDLLLAVASALGERPTVWVTESGERAVALQAGGRSVRGLPPPTRSLWTLVRNVVAAARLVAAERPRLVVTSGAGAVVAFAALARLTGARVVFMETMARVSNPSASGRVLSRIADSVVVQWPEMTAVYPGSVVCRPALCEGIPDRSPESGRGTFVAVGFHGAPFDRLLEAVDRAVGAGWLEEPVVAQAGPAAYRPQHFRTVGYLSAQELREAVAGARHVVCHAGAGIISTALRAGRRPLVMPRRADRREHVDDHQAQIVAKLAELSLVVPLDEEIGVEEARAGLEPVRPLTRNGLPSVQDVLERAVAAYDRTGRARDAARAGRGGTPAHDAGAPSAPG